MGHVHKPVQQLEYWAARHDNGWVTNALENPDGSYAAWAAPDSTLASVDYIEIDAATAMHAAEYALRIKSGHAECSPDCSGWGLQPHPVVSDVEH